jgi:hypothetical protein
MRFEILSSGIDMDVEISKWGLRLITDTPEPSDKSNFKEAPTRSSIFYEGENLVLASSDPPVTLDSATITLEGAVGELEDLDVRLPAFDGVFEFILSIQSSFSANDLANVEIRLRSPNGTSAVLVNPATSPFIPADKDPVFGEIIFDDEADKVLADLVNPFEGRIRPHSPLSVFDGENPNGVWTIELAALNQAIPTDAVLRRWNLIVNPDRLLKRAPIEVIQNWYGVKDCQIQLILRQNLLSDGKNQNRLLGRPNFIWM